MGHRIWHGVARSRESRGYHHNPMDLDADLRFLTCVIYVADVLSAREGIGFSGTVASKNLDPKVLSDLGLSEEVINEVAESIPEAYEVADQMFN